MVTRLAMRLTVAVVSMSCHFLRISDVRNQEGPLVERAFPTGDFAESLADAALKGDHQERASLGLGVIQETGNLTDHAVPF